MSGVQSTGACMSLAAAGRWIVRIDQVREFMDSRPQRDFRIKKKDDRLNQIISNINDTISKGNEVFTVGTNGQGEIIICIKYFNGGICDVRAEVKNTLIL